MLPTKKNQNWFPSIFNDFIGSDWVERLHSASPMNIIETENEFKVEMAAPGLTKDDFNVKVTNDNLLLYVSNRRRSRRKRTRKEDICVKNFRTLNFSRTSFCRTT